MKRKRLRKIFCSMQNVLELQSLYDLVDLLELSMLISASLPYIYIIWWSEQGIGTWKKSILLDAWIPFILLFLKNCYGRFKINTRCYTCREQILQKKWLCVKKMTGRRIKIVLKFHIFNANKGLGFWLENRCSRKVLKGLL